MEPLEMEVVDNRKKKGTYYWKLRVAFCICFMITILVFFVLFVVFFFCFIGVAVKNSSLQKKLDSIERITVGILWRESETMEEGGEFDFQLSSAARYAVKNLNKEKEWKGPKIELKWCGNECEDRDVRKLLNEEDVDFFVGPTSSSDVFSTLEEYHKNNKEKKKLFLLPSAAHTELTSQFDNTIRMVPGNRERAAAYLSLFGEKKLDMVNFDDGSFGNCSDFTVFPVFRQGVGSSNFIGHMKDLTGGVGNDFEFQLHFIQNANITKDTIMEKGDWEEIALEIENHPSECKLVFLYLSTNDTFDYYDSDAWLNFGDCLSCESPCPVTCTRHIGAKIEFSGVSSGSWHGLSLADTGFEFLSYFGDNVEFNDERIALYDYVHSESNRVIFNLSPYIAFVYDSFLLLKSSVAMMRRKDIRRSEVQEVSEMVYGTTGFLKLDGENFERKEGTYGRFKHEFFKNLEYKYENDLSFTHDWSIIGYMTTSSMNLNFSHLFVSDDPLTVDFNYDDIGLAGFSYPSFILYDVDDEWKATCDAIVRFLYGPGLLLELVLDLDFIGDGNVSVPLREETTFLLDCPGTSELHSCFPISNEVFSCITMEMETEDIETRRKTKGREKKVNRNRRLVKQSNRDANLKKPSKTSKMKNKKYNKRRK